MNIFNDCLKQDCQIKCSNILLQKGKNVPDLGNIWATGVEQA